jgi:hypothetical protein
MMDPSTTASSAIHTVLKQEVFRFTRLLNVIHASLNSLYQSIHGLVLLSVDIEETYKSLLINQVPRQWQVGAFSDFALEGCRKFGGGGEPEGSQSNPWSDFVKNLCF